MNDAQQDAQVKKQEHWRLTAVSQNKPLHPTAVSGPQWGTGRRKEQQGRDRKSKDFKHPVVPLVPKLQIMLDLKNKVSMLAQWVTALATHPDDPSLIPATHVKVEEENQLHFLLAVNPVQWKVPHGTNLLLAIRNSVEQTATG